MNSALFIFWFSVIFIGYAYLGYPLYLLILSESREKPVAKKMPTVPPKVSVIIAAKDEETNIGDRLKNLMNQDYPHKNLEIIVVSDGSGDQTNKIVEEYSKQSPSIKLIHYTPARGKPSALNQGVEAANGEILVFADSRQIFRSSAISELVANFSDPAVGCVSGELILTENKSEGAKLEMGVYWKYEKWIRKTESTTGSVVGTTGAIYAIRKVLYKKLPSATLLDDVLTPMNVVFQGYRVVYDGQAVAYDRVSKHALQEWHRKVRTLAGNWQLLRLKPLLLSPGKNSIAFRFFSHKISRLLVPFFLIAAFLSNLYLSSYLYHLLLSLQIAFYTTAMISIVIPYTRKIRLLNIVYFFCILNAAAIAGFFKFACGNTATAWKRPIGSSKAL